MTIVLKNGDLFTSKVDMICHGVNTKGKMGFGIAVEFRKRYPEMYLKYRDMCLNETLQPGNAFFYQLKNGKWVGNLASQDFPGPHARLKWITESVGRAVDFAKENDLSSIGLPRIGCGIGSQKWTDVYYELVSNFEESPITIEVWSL